MPLVLPELDVLLAALVALAVCLLIIAFTKAFFGTVGGFLGKLPVVGGWIDATGNHIAQRITHVFGGFATALEGIVGASWHSMARIVDKLGHELAAHAGLLATIASFVPGVGVLGGLYRLIVEARGIAARLYHAAAAVGHDALNVGRQALQGIGNDVLPRIRSLDHELTRVLGKTIPGLRTADRTLTRDIDNLWKWTRKHTLVAGTTAFFAAVAVALSKLGLDWIRCPSAKQVFNKRGCNMWNDLDGLLAAALAVATSLSLVELAKAEQEVIGDLTAVVQDFWQV